MFSDVPAALDAQFGRAERQGPAYVGQSLEIARRLAEDEHVVQVRILSLDGDTVSIRQDHRSSRLNLLVAGGEVLRAAFC